MVAGGAEEERLVVDHVGLLGIEDGDGAGDDVELVLAGQALQELHEAIDLPGEVADLPVDGPVEVPDA